MTIRETIYKKLHTEKKVPTRYKEDIEKLREMLEEFDPTVITTPLYELFEGWLEFSESQCAGFLNVSEDSIGNFLDWIGYDDSTD